MNATERAEQQVRWITGVDPLAARFRPVNNRMRNRAIEQFDEPGTQLNLSECLLLTLEPMELPDIDEHVAKLLR